MMMKTSLTGVPFPPNYSIIILVSILFISIIYQTLRKWFKWTSVGEFLISNSDKNNILAQKEKFIITRIPFYLLTIVTLGLVSNFSDGLSDGLVYSYVDIIFFVLVVSSLYYGLINFVYEPELLSIGSILLALLLMGYYFDIFTEINNILTFTFLFIGVAWVAIGYIYKAKTIKLQA